MFVSTGAAFSRLRFWGTGAGAVSRHHTGVIAECSSSRRILEDVLFTSAAPFQAHDAFALQLSYDGDHLLLRGLDVLDLDRTQSLHVLQQHGRAALRHTLQQMLAD